LPAQLYLAQLSLAQLAQERDRGGVTDPLDRFVVNLRRLREERGISQEKLAHRANLSPSHVAKIEQRKREPGVRTIAKLTRGLRVSAAELFEGIDGR
jgi:ribosome-binding protein aMBF1 (putative translation factor)